jgi:hypothetical protein
VSDTISSADSGFQRHYQSVRERFLATSRKDGSPNTSRTFWERAGGALGVDLLGSVAGMFDPDMPDEGLPLPALQQTFHAAGFEQFEVHWADCGEVVFSARAQSATA